jgi:tetratricopeptide (TPR) repeat protein
MTEKYYLRRMKFLKPILLCAISSLLIISCTQKQPCTDGINSLPLFGGVKKCDEQIGFDKKFIAESDKGMDRKNAAENYVAMGWQYVYAKKVDTAIMRFNQAWLLDSLNADLYWGLGNVLAMQGKFKESLPFYGKSVKLNPRNVKALQDMSISYGNTFFETKEDKYLGAAIAVLEDAVKLEPKNAAINAQLAGAYSYFAQKDSANKYLKIADGLDPKAVNPQIRKMVAGK